LFELAWFTGNKGQQMSDEESSYDAFLDQVQERQDNITQTQASLAITEQPSLITNVTLKPHQITGISWLLSLYELENGGGGILGDDMGLGKTGQCISLFALLKERYKLDGPLLIVCPLSLIQNWMQEFERFCPSLTVSRYIGNKEERTTTQNNILTFIKQQPKDQWVII
jgi:ATP-dependent DNA helicase